MENNKIPDEVKDKSTFTEKFESINLIQLIVGTGLTASLVLTIFYGSDDLANTIATGLIGFLGGVAVSK